MRIFSKIIAAIVFLIVTAIVLSPLGAGIGESGSLVIFVGAGLVALVCLIAPSGRRAWGRGFLLNGLFLVAMPLLIIPLISKAYSETTAQAALTATSDFENAAAEVGAGIGSALFFGAASFVGILLGAIFVILGLVMVLGGRREVIVVDQTQ